MKILINILKNYLILFDIIKQDNEHKSVIQSIILIRKIII